MIKLLAVDDMDGMYRVYLDLLEGVDDIRMVGFAMNGAEALLLYRRLAPDLVVMNINMPVLDGILATDIMTQLYPQARIFMHSVALQEPNITRAREAGALAFLAKPATQEEFVQFVRQTLAYPTEYLPSRVNATTQVELDLDFADRCFLAARWLGHSFRTVGPGSRVCTSSIGIWKRRRWPACHGMTGPTPPSKI